MFAPDDEDAHATTADDLFDFDAEFDAAFGELDDDDDDDDDAAQPKRTKFKDRD